MLDMMSYHFRRKLFVDKNERYVQKDSAPTHKAKKKQKWLREHVPDFNEAGDGPTSSPDLKTLDYKLYSVLGECACAWRYQNLDSLKAVIVKTVKEIPPAMIRDDWWLAQKFTACVQTKSRPLKCLFWSIF